jgi:hypothetical protein
MLVIYFGPDRTGCALYECEAVAYEGDHSIEYIIDMLNRGRVLNAISWRIF